jgi:hypothetical protein
MYLIMQALELRLQLLAERLNYTPPRGPLATGISSAMPPDKLCVAHSRLVGTVEKVAAI